MTLLRASCQRSSLEEFYLELQDPAHPTVIESGRMMLALLPLLQQTCASIPVWGLTSHATLVLLAHDDYTSPWFVRIVPQTWASPSYEVHYLMPAAEAPWPDAVVGGSAPTVERANDLVAIAIARCSAWQNSL